MQGAATAAQRSAALLNPGVAAHRQPRSGGRIVGRRRPRDRQEDRVGRGVRAPQLPRRGDDPARPAGGAAPADGLGRLVGGADPRSDRTTVADVRGQARRECRSPTRSAARCGAGSRSRTSRSRTSGPTDTRIPHRCCTTSTSSPSRVRSSRSSADRVGKVDARQPHHPLLRRHGRTGDDRRRRRSRRDPRIACSRAVTTVLQQPNMFSGTIETEHQFRCRRRRSAPVDVVTASKAAEADSFVEDRSGRLPRRSEAARRELLRRAAPATLDRASARPPTSHPDPRRHHERARRRDRGTGAGRHSRSHGRHARSSSSRSASAPSSPRT